MRILKDALNVLATGRTPGALVTLDYQWDAPFDRDTYMRDVPAMLKEEGGQKQEWKPA